MTRGAQRVIDLRVRRELALDVHATVDGTDGFLETAGDRDHA
jgi:hypothetical protein